MLYILKIFYTGWAFGESNCGDWAPYVC